MSIDSVVRPTVVVRRIMRKYGAEERYTNTYKTCTSVKCYRFDIQQIDDCVSEITRELNAINQTFEVDVTAGSGIWGKAQHGSLIVKLRK